MVSVFTTKIISKSGVMRKLWEVPDLSSLLILVMVLWVCWYVTKKNEKE